MIKHNFINKDDGLSGKVILVTGGTSGIGEASVKKLFSCGAKVVFTGRNKVKANEIIAELEDETKGSIEFIQADLNDFSTLDGLFEKVVQQFGRLDAAFNCAGIVGKDSPLQGMAFHETSFDNWQQVMTVNVTGLWYCLKKQLEIMYQQRSGVILNCASVAALRCSDSKSPAYTASKHAVSGLSKALAAQYAPHHIRINVICPGVIDTPLLGDMRNKILEELQSKNKGAAIGSSQEVAEIVSFLLSERSSYINGAQLTVDAGGLTGVI